jgi:hypothetical protein
MTIDDLKVIHDSMNMNDPCDMAVYACTIITFYCVAILDEFTVPNMRQHFDLEKYITRRHISMLKDKDGLHVIKFRIPVTKCDAVVHIYSLRLQIPLCTQRPLSFGFHL